MKPSKPYLSRLLCLNFYSEQCKGKSNSYVSDSFMLESSNCCFSKSYLMFHQLLNPLRLFNVFFPPHYRLSALCGFYQSSMCLVFNPYLSKLNDFMNRLTLTSGSLHRCFSLHATLFHVQLLYFLCLKVIFSARLTLSSLFKTTKLKFNLWQHTQVNM